ncbi:hypothetical protein [Arsenicicoccus dermatophilus]|uniref:hypothetical protein n=1 Tax=Arsenicicoccus dermatophilus TaxID=1076331 RepID=UPI001F4CED0B|nr:hypothetical protein [Arsenicicoccus dermatophilus]MCH8612386.1 hypothetical protein [Arsenicicoccus dermatophilus]
MELLLWATLAVVLAVVGRRVRGRVRARHARAWAAGARREMVALLVDEREELDQQGHVTVVGDVLEWSCDIWRWRTPLHLPGDAVCTVLEDEHRQETWVLEACQGPDGRRLLVGVPLAAVDALDALRRSSRPTGADGVVPGGPAPGRRARSRPAQVVAALGALCLLGACLLWPIWLTSVEVVARVDETPHDGSCVVSWLDPRTADRVSGVHVDCSEHDGRPVQAGDPIQVRAHTGPLRGEGMSDEGLSSFLRFWAPGLGIGLLALAGWLRRRTRARFTDIPAITLQPVLAATAPPSSPLARDPLVRRALELSAREGWDDEGDPDPEPLSLEEVRSWSGQFWLTLAAGGWWVVLVLAALTAGLATDEGDARRWAPLSALALLLALAVQAVRVWRGQVPWGGVVSGGDGGWDVLGGERVEQSSHAGV